MKKIFLIGVLGFTVRDLNSVLEREFIVKLCSDDEEIVRGLFNMETPDLVLIDANGFDREHLGMLDFIMRENSTLPIRIIGTKDDLEPFSDYLADDSRFGCITRPITSSRIVREIKNALRMEGGLLMSKEELKAAENKKKILLVDDSAITLRSIKAQLQDYYEVALAKSGNQALKFLETNVPDLILLDYDMPEMDGKEVFEIILGNENTESVPVIFLTGIKDKQRIIDVLSLKPAGYLLKPVDNEMLIETIMKTLDEI